MRFGAMNFPVRPVLEEIDAFGALQMDYLELAMDSPMAHHRLIRECKAAIRRALGQWKMGPVCHLHVSDNNGRCDEHLPVGHGNIGFKAMARALKRIGYDDTMTLEVFSPNRADLVTSRRKLEKMLEI